MSWNVIFEPAVRKYLNKQIARTHERLLAGLRKLEHEPFNHLTRYVGPYYKLRIGDYRAFIDIDFTTRTLYVRKLGHRREIYK
jgi:mRNA interferase RelE/StbE